MVFPINLYSDPEYQKLSWSPRCVLHVIYARSNGAQKCWPSCQCIAEDLGLSSRQVTRALNELVKFGLIERQFRPGTSSIYVPNGYDYQSPLTNSHPYPRPIVIPPLTGSHTTPDYQSYEQSKEQSKGSKAEEPDHPALSKNQEKPQEPARSSRSLASDLMSTRAPVVEKVPEPSDLSKVLLALPKGSRQGTNRKICDEHFEKAVKLSGGVQNLIKAAHRYSQAFQQGAMLKEAHWWLKDEIYLQYLDDEEKPEPIQEKKPEKPPYECNLHYDPSIHKRKRVS